jgi:transcriptional regulator
MIVEADVVDGEKVETLLDRLFARSDTAYVHIHYAKRGCFAALVERL